MIAGRWGFKQIKINEQSKQRIKLSTQIAGVAIAIAATNEQLIPTFSITDATEYERQPKLLNDTTQQPSDKSFLRSVYRMQSQAPPPPFVHPIPQP